MKEIPPTRYTSTRDFSGHAGAIRRQNTRSQISKQQITEMDFKDQIIFTLKTRCNQNLTNDNYENFKIQTDRYSIIF